MRLSFSIFIVTIMATIMGCQNPAFLGVHHHSPYAAQPVAGPGPGVVPPSQTPLPQMPLAPPVRSAAIPATPSMYYPMALKSPYDSPESGIASGGVSPVAPAPVIPSHAIGNISAAAATPAQNPTQSSTSQINFESPEALIIHYDARVPGAFDSEPLVCPATHEFGHGKVYRLKLSNIPGRPGKELYPTLEVAPVNSRTFAYLVHCPIPIAFTENDFDQVLSGNLITKVIYLPNREFQGLATAGIGTIVNTDLEPGVDPITEAQNRGSILAIIRMGNKDLRLTENELRRRTAVVNSMPPGAPQVAFQNEPVISSIPGNPISGYNIPPYGTPMTKTTTGIPGPPQLPQSMDSGYRYPVIYAEPIPAPPSVRSYAPPAPPMPPTGTPYGYQPPMPPNQYYQQMPPNYGYPPIMQGPTPTLAPGIR
ncbi:MAG: hypothetical protein LBP59_04865 [Planctomycetaceae bacterium]|nr:hypothetical protein [Planctomycetaceae bacterium]